MTHTAEEVRARAAIYADINVPETADMLTAHAADLERRAEGVTDELVKRALDIFVGGNQYTSEYQCQRMRAVLLAVWPVAAEPMVQTEAISREVLAIGVQARNIELERQRLAGEQGNETRALQAGISAALGSQLAEPVAQGEVVGWEKAKSIARMAVHGENGRGTIGADRRFLEDRVASAILSTLTSHTQSRAIPDGWVLVPRNPTDEMWEAASSRVEKHTVVNENGTLHRDPLAHAFLAFLAAAPQPGKPQ